jgi:hypothetical protein
MQLEFHHGLFKPARLRTRRRRVTLADLITLKRLILTSALFAILTGLASCRRQESTGTPLAPTIGTFASLNGIVRDLSRNPLSGVVVAIPGSSKTTAADGLFAFSDFPEGAIPLTVRREGLLNFSQIVMASGAVTLDIPMKPADAVRMAGNWIGTWTTTALNRTGGLTMSVAISTVAEAVQVALDVNGNLVADYDPPGDVFPGVLTSAGSVRISRASPTYGNVTADVTADGLIVGSATRVPIGTATRLDFTGTISATATNVNYTITFDDGSSTAGTATLLKSRP